MSIFRKRQPDLQIEITIRIDGREIDLNDHGQSYTLDQPDPAPIGLDHATWLAEEKRRLETLRRQGEIFEQMKADIDALPETDRVHYRPRYGTGQIVEIDEGNMTKGEGRT